MLFFVNKMKIFISVFFTFTIIAKIGCCTTDTECPTSDFLCTSGQCTCKQGYLLSSDKSKCLPYVTEYYGECSENTQCQWLGANSECNYVCKCKTGYRWYLGECKRYVGLGEQCQTDVDCYDGYNPQSLSCLDGKCTCSDGYYPRGNYDCRKSASKVNDKCALDIDCKFNNAECHLGKCKTKTTRLLLGEKKEEEITHSTFSYQISSVKQCKTAEDCADIPNSECYEKTGTCICQKKYFFNSDATECIPEIGVHTGCTNDTDCVIRPGKCDNGVCYCRDYYVVDDGNRNCVKTISQNNWNCLSKEWCYAWGKYSFCSSSETCNCSQLSDFDEQNSLCKRNNKEDPGICTSDYECMYIKNGHCIDEACGCLNNFVLQDNSTCVPNIGAPCDEEMGCPIPHSLCSDEGICECDDGYVAYQNASCHLKRDHLGEDCEVDVQCSVNIRHSKCLGETCDCDENYLPHNNSCMEKKRYGSYCNNLLECKISIDSVVCRNRKCQCPTSYTWKNNKCSSSGIISGNSFVLAIALVLKSVLSVYC